MYAISRMSSGPKANSMHRAFGAARTSALLFIAAVSLTALPPNHSVTQYGHAVWSRYDGQLPGAVYALTQTRDGSLWVGTEFGLYRFDGVTFSPWKPPPGDQLPDQMITALAPDPGGGLWVGTRRGLSYSSGGTLRNYRTSQDLNGPGVSSVVVDDTGTVWVGTVAYNSGGLCRVQQNRLACYGPADGYDGGGVVSLSVDKSDSLWIGSVGGLYEWRSGAFRRHTPRASIQAVVGEPDGNPVVSSGGRVSKMVRERLLDYADDPSIRSAHPRILFSDRDGALWIGTSGNGLLHIYHGRVDRFVRADGLSGDLVLCLFEDREGNIWTGTTGGLDRFRDLPVIMISKKEGLSADTVVSAFPSKQGGVWLGTTQGLNRIHGPETDVVGFPGISIGAVFEDSSGTVWVDSPHGLFFSAPEGFRPLKIPRGRRIDSVATVAQDPGGALWLSDPSRGLIRVESGQVVKIIPWSRFHDRLALALEVNPVNGRLLMGFAQGGVAEFEDGRETHWYTSGLGRDAVTDLHVDPDGTLWIATEGGLGRLKNSKVTMLTASNGLPCQQIHAMVEDNDRSLWLHTSCGLLRITRAELTRWSADPRISPQYRVFGARDGMRFRIQTAGYFRGAVKSNDGRLWFPEPDGVAVVDPRHLPYNRLPPPVEIESVLADQTSYRIRPALRLPPITGNVQIEYTAFSLVDPEQVRFKYKLDGYDAGWVDAGGRRLALYPRLAPGKYRFHVIAANNDQVWNNVGEELDFSVAPLFYQTIWFRVLAVLLGAGILWLAYALRVKRIEARLSLRFEERMKERARIARDLHDTLLQNIAGFALQIDALSKIVTAPISVRDQLRELRQQAEAWLRETRESVWDLRPQDSEHSDDLAREIRRIGEQITEGKGIAFRVRIDGNPQEVETRTHRALLRIVQEAVRNAAAHSNAGAIAVHLSYLDEGQLSLEISDNGRGFDSEALPAKHGHFGLAAMRERARDIGAEIQIDAAPGRGVRIALRCPIAFSARSHK